MDQRSIQDRYFNQAKREGYLARSAYKLLQIQQAKRLLRPRDRVLDLGCAPGSWLQVVGEIIGPEGLAVGVDLTGVRHPMPANVSTVVGDVFELQGAQVLPEAGLRFDVVLSDMAPRTSGHGDDLKSAHLCRRVLDLLPDLLVPGGSLAMKILEGAEYSDVLSQTARQFAGARGFKPEASRDASREMYILATGFAPHRVQRSSIFAPARS